MTSLTSIDSGELNIFRQSLRKFLETRVQPDYLKWEKAEIFPRTVWNELGEAGFLGVDLPENYGGPEAPFPFSMIVLEELSRIGAAALASSVLVHSDIVAHYILHWGTEAQKKHWLPKMVSGEAVGAIAMTEPGAGSDLQGITTTAVRQGDHFIINGSKTFITNGQHADMVIVAAKTAPQGGAKGISLFLVDVNTPGFQKGRNLEKIGLHSGDTSELYFEDVKVSETTILGKENGGFMHLMNELPRERLGMSVMAVAASEGTLQWTLDYAHQRQLFAQPLAKFQNTRFKLAEAKTLIEVNRAFVEKCMAQYMEQKLDATTAAMAKLSATEMQNRIADECLQLFGGYGYMLEYPVSRAFVDARVQRIYGGTSEVMKEIIARSILGK
ncbi:MAG: acyl-CoA dehydrogenase family protein [SAR324 cluster bacterium]|nr:acyl-CoA dehydrogenase family protein [SAR324 cluster bacterium]